MKRLKKAMLMPWAGGAAPPSALLTNLISYWQLEQASGTRPDSVLTSANDLTPTNAPGNNPGIIGNAVQLTAASTQSLSKTDNASLSTGDIDFTIAAWVFLDSLGVERAIASKYANTGSGEWLFRVLATNALSFFVVNQSTTANASAATVATLSASTWNFCVGWHDSVNNVIKCCVNDGAVATAAWANTIQDSTEPLNIGASGSGSARLMNGRIDEVGFWKRLLTAAEITQLYNAGAGRTYPFIGT